MHRIICLSTAGRCRQLLVYVCLLIVFLGGCAPFAAKRVVPPPPRTTVTKRPPEVPVPPVQSRPYVKPRAEDRPVVIRPPGAERPVVTEPEPPVEPPVATEPPVEERPLVTEPGQEENPAAAGQPPAPERQAVTEPLTDYKPITGRAAGIYREAEEAMQAGRFAPAEMLLERALRIEPRNAHYWYTLGLAKFRQKQYPQAVQFCLKAESLAGSQPGLLARNQVLLTQAKKAAGMQ